MPATVPRPPRLFVALGIAIIALAPLLPNAAALHYAVVDPQWTLLPDEVLVCVCSTPAPDDEQPLPLFSALPSRAPPSTSQA